MIVIFILCISSLLASSGEDSPTLNCTEFCIDHCNQTIPSFEYCLDTCDPPVSGRYTMSSRPTRNNETSLYPYYELSWTGKTDPIMCQSDLFLDLTFSNTHYYSPQESSTITFDATTSFEDANEYICRNTGAAPSNECNSDIMPMDYYSTIFENICPWNNVTCFNTFYCRNATTEPSLFPWSAKYGFCVCVDMLYSFEYIDVLQPFTYPSGPTYHSANLSYTYHSANLGYVDGWCNTYNRLLYESESNTEKPSKATHLDKTITWILIGIFILV